MNVFLNFDSLLSGKNIRTKVLQWLTFTTPALRLGALQRQLASLFPIENPDVGKASQSSIFIENREYSCFWEQWDKYFSLLTAA